MQHPVIPMLRNATPAVRRAYRGFENAWRFQWQRDFGLNRIEEIGWVHPSGSLSRQLMPMAVTCLSRTIRRPTAMVTLSIRAWMVVLAVTALGAARGVEAQDASSRLATYQTVEGERYFALALQPTQKADWQAAVRPAA